MRLIELATRSGMLVSDREVRRVGVSAARFRRWRDEGRWLQVAPGWYRHAATPLTFAMQARAGSAWLARRGGLHGTSALAWLGVDVDEPPSVEFLVERRRRSIPNWMTIHTTTKWDRGDIVNHRGVRTTIATRALIDFAAQRPSASELERAIDSAIRLRRTALPRLLQRMAELAGPGMRGIPLLRELLLDSGGESHLERRFLRLLRQAGLPRPECQVVFRRGGQRVARVDFRFTGTNVVVEVSGKLGHSTERDRQRDARRRNELQLQGQVVLEFTTADVIDDPTHVIATLIKSLRVAA